jgi:putative sigma-54 modulation protein
MALEVIVKGKNIEIPADLEQYTLRKLSKLTKLSQRLQSAKATFTQNASKKRHQSYRVEVAIKAPGQTLRAEEDNGSFYSAVDSVLDKLRRQLKKLKSKRTEKPRAKASKAEAPALDLEPIVVEELGIEPPQIVVREFPIKPMSTAEAIMQLEVTGGNLLLFVNEQSVVNCLRKRPKGGYTLLIPEEEKK